jgi:uncharacterized protein
MESSPNRKVLSVVSHGAIFLSSTLVAIAIPIVIMLTTDDAIVKENAKESLNFHINLYAYAILFGLLTLVLVGIPLLILLGIASFVLPIIAIVKVLDNPGVAYRYPFIFRVL